MPEPAAARTPHLPNTRPFPASTMVLADRPAIYHGDANWSWSAQMPARYFNLWVLMEGTVKMTLRGETFLRSRPSYFLLPPGERVVAVNAGAGPLINFTLHVGREALDMAWARRSLRATWGLPVRELDAFLEGARRCVDAWNRGSEPHRLWATAQAHALLLRFWVDAATPVESPVRERMFALAGRIRQHPETPWRIAALAREGGYSRSRFTRLFTDATGVPPRTFITRCRMDRARAFLAESEMGMKEIAAALGYGDLFFFSRHFKQITGMAPSAYRKAARSS